MMLLGRLGWAVITKPKVRIMASTINNHFSLSKIGELLFARQTPAVAAETHKGLTGWFTDWRGQREAANELSRLSDRELADIGLTRQEIPAVVRRGKR
jgi:uncharacterized protein YjiS (DUF1127 family)